MKQFFRKCQAARENQLLNHLDPFPLFKENVKLFSLSDFFAVSDGKLIPQLQKIHREFSMHIKQECQVRFLMHFFFNIESCRYVPHLEVYQITRKLQ